MKGFLGIRWTVGRKLALAFGALVAIVVTMGVVSFVVLSSLEDKHERVVAAAAPAFDAQTRAQVDALNGDFGVAGRQLARAARDRARRRDRARDRARAVDHARR